MTREPVQSANIKSIGYSLPTQTLEIEFANNGGVYMFQGVSAETHRNLMRAASIGKYFAAYVKNKYPYAKLTEESSHGQLP